MRHVLIPPFPRFDKVVMCLCGKVLKIGDFCNTLCCCDNASCDYDTIIIVPTSRMPYLLHILMCRFGPVLLDCVDSSEKVPFGPRTYVAFLICPRQHHAHQ